MKRNCAKIEAVFSLVEFSKKTSFFVNSNFLAKFSHYFAKFSVIISNSIGTQGKQCLV